MALSDQASYADTGAEFLAHWAQVDAELGGGGLVLPGNVDRTAADGLYHGLMGHREVLIRLENDGEVAQGQLELLRPVAVGRMREFCETLRMFWAGLPVVEALPGMPGATAALEHVLRAVRRVLRLWRRVNEGTAPAGVVLPLVLSRDGGFSRGDLEELYGLLLAAQVEEEDAETDLDVARAERGAMERGLRRTLAQYRVLVPVRCGRDSTFSRTLPRLSPLPGHTPERPLAQGALAGEVFRISWEALEEPDLKCWQVRGCRAGRYNKARERVLATVPPEGPLVWEVARKAAGAGSFRIYAVLRTGNERGSRTVPGPDAPPGKGE